MIKTVIFDLGAVLIDWDPRHLYRKIFAEEQQMNDFLATICTPDWNEQQDAGRTLHEATESLVAQHPEHEPNIHAFYGRWPEMLNGAIQGTVDILQELKESGKYKLYALTNWSAETFVIAQQQFEFLGWFDGIVVSGVERSRKPYPEFYQILLDRYNVAPAETIFIDDNARNITAAEKLGIKSIQFKSPQALRQQLQQLSII